MKKRASTILLIEDDDDHADLTCLALEAEGRHHIRRASDGEQAWAYLADAGRAPDRPIPDLVLLDLNLPGIDGHEVLRRIKHHERLRSIPVIVLTTSLAEKDRGEAYANHANSYLVKPVTSDRFHAMLRDVTRYWCTWNEPDAPEVRP